MRTKLKINFLSKSRKTFLLCGLFVLLLWNIFNGIVRSADNPNPEGNGLNQEEINDSMNKIREEIKQVQSKISDYDAELKTQQKKARTLKKEVSTYENNIYKNQLEIKETKLKIEETEMEIEETGKKIKESISKVEKDKEMLKNSLKDIYAYEQDSMLEILMTKENISDFFNEVSAMESVKDEIYKTIVDIKSKKEELTKKQEDLEGQQEEQGELIKMREEQNKSIDELKDQKKELLDMTKNEEKKFQDLLNENKSILPSLKAQLHELQSLGQTIKYDDAISAAKFVGAAKGVRPAYLLGILKVESGLGTNVGNGNYKVDMNSRQRPTFENITEELGYDPNLMPVSKKPKSYSGWGGAMGPAQMMPTTWMIYKNEVSEITGHYPPDPWNLTDAIAAMAVKVSKINGVTSGDYNAEYEAAGIYFAGNNWRKFKFYPDRVMLYADLYSKELGL